MIFLYNDYIKKRKPKSKGEQYSIDYSKYCSDFFINPNTIRNALYLYSTLTEIFSKIKYEEKIEEFKKSYPVIKSLVYKDNLIKCFLYSSGSLTVFKI